MVIMLTGLIFSGIVGLLVSMYLFPAVMLVVGVLCVLGLLFMFAMTAAMILVGAPPFATRKDHKRGPGGPPGDG